MTILTIRTDRPEAEVGLFVGTEKLAYKTWQAHRELSQTIHTQILTLLNKVGKNWQDIDGIVCFKGPGSFTGLRIGATVANTLAQELEIPIIGEAGDEWIDAGLNRIIDHQNDKIIVPEYGQEPHITTQKK